MNKWHDVFDKEDCSKDLEELHKKKLEEEEYLVSGLVRILVQGILAGTELLKNLF